MVRIIRDPLNPNGLTAPRSIRFDPFANIANVGWVGPIVLLMGAFGPAETGHNLVVESWKLEIPDQSFTDSLLDLPPDATIEQVIEFHRKSEAAFRALFGPVVGEEQGSTCAFKIIMNPALITSHYRDVYQPDPLEPEEGGVMTTLLNLTDNEPMSGKIRSAVYVGKALAHDITVQDEDHYRNVVQTSGIDAALDAMMLPEEFLMYRAVDPLDPSPPPPEPLITEIATTSNSLTRWAWDYVRKSVDPFPVPLLEAA